MLGETNDERIASEFTQISWIVETQSRRNDGPVGQPIFHTGANN